MNPSILELPDSRLAQFVCFGRRAVWQFLGEPDAFERGRFEGAEFDSEEVLQSLPVSEQRDPERCWNRRTVPGVGAYACCWGCLLSGGSVFIEYQRQPHEPRDNRTGHFASWEDAMVWVQS